MKTNSQNNRIATFGILICLVLLVTAITLDYGYNKTLETKLNALETRLEASNRTINELEQEVKTINANTKRLAIVTADHTTWLEYVQDNKLSHEDLNLLMGDMVNKIIESLEE